MEEILIDFTRKMHLDKKIQEVLELWHNLFKDTSHQYSEFEDSDIEYFVGCMLYNHFDFEYALDTMKTIDLSYDFLSVLGDTYEVVNQKIDSIKFENEDEKLDFLQTYLSEVKTLYNEDALYLLNRLSYHVDGIKQRQVQNIKSQTVDFVTPKVKSRNPLLR